MSKTDLLNQFAAILDACDSREMVPFFIVCGKPEDFIDGNGSVMVTPFVTNKGSIKDYGIMLLCKQLGENVPHSEEKIKVGNVFGLGVNKN